MNLTFRPIDQWLGETTKARRYSQFSASYGQTLDLLGRELSFLKATNVVIQLALKESDIRLDGLPRAQARPSHPGVILAFDSVHGPLKYATDTFHEWQGNLRAIALSLEALRKVDRYGVSKRGEQYTGWRALSAGEGAPMTREVAERFLKEHGGSFREAVKRLHPDAGGNEEDFKRLQEAERILEDE